MTSKKAPSAKKQTPKVSSEIFDALDEGKLELMEKLLKQGVNPNSQDQAHKSLLYLATEDNDYDAVDLLLNHGADVDFPFNLLEASDAKAKNKELRAPNAIDPTPLLYAAAHGYKKIVKRLLKASPNLKLRNHYGGNALIPAAAKGHFDTAKLLLEKTEIDVNFINHLGWTALIEVVLLSEPEDQIAMAQLLLEHGADVNIADKNGTSAIEHAKESGGKRLYELISKYQ